MKGEQSMNDLSVKFVEASFKNDKGEDVVFYRVRVTVEDGSSKPYYIDFKPTRDQVMILKDKVIIERV